MDSIGITQKELSAMRTADDYYFNCSEKEHSAIITLKKKIDVNGFKTEAEQQITFPCSFHLYGKDTGYWYHAFFHPYLDGAWQALVKIAKPGDVVKFHVMGNATSEHMRDCGMTVSHLTVSIDRKGEILINHLILAYEVNLVGSSAQAVYPHESRAQAA